MKTNRKLIAFMNSYSHGKSGGDMVFIEIAKRLKDFDKVIITSYLGKELCVNSGLKGDYYLTTHEREFDNVILTYIKRAIKAFFLKNVIQGNDIFLGTSDFFPDVLPIFLLKMRNRKNKLVQHIFHLIPSSRKIPFYSQRISFFFIKHSADIIVVDNSLLKDKLASQGFRSEKIVVNYPGIDTGFLKSIKPSAKKCYDAVFMAQLRPSKGINDLIDVWQKVRKKLPNTRLAIIGKGEKKSINGVDYLGYLEDAEAFPLIKSSKVFLFPSHEEGFGIAALQAQALGLPVIAWDLPVFSEIFPEGMKTIAMGDKEAFASSIVYLLTDTAAYRKLSQEAVDNTRRFDWDETAKRERDLLMMNI